MRAGAADGTPAILCAAEFLDLIHGRRERRESAADLGEGRSTVCALEEQMLSGHVDASQGDGETEQRGHDAEITATVRSGHKRRGEREERDLIRCAC